MRTSSISLAAKALHIIALDQLLAWEGDAGSMLAPDEYVEFFGAENREQIDSAIEILKQRGLVRSRKFLEVDGTREFEELRVTAFAWLQLLPSDGDAKG
jgi:hypothetical protein